MATLRLKEQYAAVEQNAEIAASASEDFAVDASAQANKRKYGSMNTLLIVNRSAQAIRISLDGSTFAEIFSNSSINIDFEDGLFFNLIRVTNLSGAAAISANTITVRYSRNMITGVV